MRNLTVDRGTRRVLDGLDLTIQQGSVTGLLGPSGCGKTTLMRAIVGVQQRRGGQRPVLGVPAGSTELRHRVGYVTQAPSVYDDLTVAREPPYFAAGARCRTARRSTAAIGRGRPDRQADQVVEPALRRPAVPGSASPSRCSAAPTCSCSTSRPSASTRCCAATCGRCSTGSPTPAPPAGVEPRDGRGRPLRPAAAHARRRADRRRHPDRLLEQTGAADVESAFLALVDRAADGGRRDDARGSCCAVDHARAHASCATTGARSRCCSCCPCALITLLSWMFDGPGDLRPVRPGAAGAVPVHRDVPGHQRGDAARAHLRHARAAARDADGQARLPRRLRPRVRPGGGRAGRARGRAGVGLRPRRGRAGLAARLVAVADAVLGTALGLLVSAFAQTEFQAVQFMPLFVVPQILLCGLFVPRDELPTSCRRSRRAAAVSYAVDAMQALAAPPPRPRSGATSASSPASPWRPWPWAPRRCAAVRRRPADARCRRPHEVAWSACRCSASRCSCSPGASG